MYRRARGGDAAVKVVRTVAEMRAGAADRGTIGPRPDDGRAARRTRVAARGRAPRERPRRHEPVRERGAVLVRRRLRALPARRGSATSSIAERAGVDVVFAPAADELYPQGFRTWVDAETSTGLEADFRPGHFRGVATVCLKLFNIVRPRPRVLRAEGRAAGRGRAQDDPRPRPRRRVARAADRARRGRPRALVAQRAPHARATASARSRFRARCRRATRTARASC